MGDSAVLGKIRSNGQS